MVNILRIKNLTFANMEPLVKNPMISKGVVDICYAGKNRNRSYISDEVMHTKLAPSVLGVPIVGEYFKETEDFGDHGGKIIIDSNGIHFEQTTIPYGFVPPNAKISYIDKTDDDGVTRKYLRADCYLWTGQYPECDRVIKTGNPQSMELENDTGYWKRIDGCDHYVIEDAVISKLCILGSDVEPCFEGAAFGKDEPGISYSLNKEDYSKFMKEFALQIRQALESEKTGGQTMTVEEYALQVEELNKQIETFTADLNAEKEKVTSLTAENEELKNFKLENESAIEKLNADNAELLAFKAESEEKMNGLNTELETLRAFKLAADKTEKENLFNSFKAKNIIDETELNNVYTEIDNLSYAELDNKLCKLYTAKMFEVQNQPKNEPVVTTFVQHEPQQMTWIDAVKAKQSK